MGDLKQLMKTLDDAKKAMENDSDIDEEEELIRKKNQELMQRFNAINDTVKIDEKLTKPTQVDTKVKNILSQSSTTGVKLEQLEMEFRSIFDKMGELFFTSGQQQNQTDNEIGDKQDKSEENKLEQEKSKHEEYNEEETTNKQQTSKNQEQELQQQS